MERRETRQECQKMAPTVGRDLLSRFRLRAFLRKLRKRVTPKPLLLQTAGCKLI